MTRNAATFVLVPGAWQGGWSWQPVARRLRAAGHPALTLTLPGLADGDSPAGLRLADAVAAVVHEVTKRDLEDVVLVAQSWGGYPVTGAAHELAGRVSKVIYYNALVPARGVPLVDENEDYATMIRTAIDASPDGTISVVPEQVPLLLPDVSEEARRLFFELLVPQPGHYFLDALDVPDVTAIGLPAAYVLSENDLALARPGTEFAARLGLTPVMVPGGHESMLTHPDEVTRALLAV
ncbi:MULTISPECIES: alpha/beta fold hydrolase [Amycolatopsis]|uniref:Pimeloyl-ACP methyl ester carboxylesterase n=2 Tax=Amycolatopsis TaxID=1813 RepID=A0A1I3URV4_9PSEU|nr:alpha/beta fold hydrolase [Amycolatopsis sacchari]SFJ85519.1 Pimeloyl-ACP methyl ester carboxylesterase [Amycolatopsis sacchari]